MEYYLIRVHYILIPISNNNTFDRFVIKCLLLTIKYLKDNERFTIILL